MSTLLIFATLYYTLYVLAMGVVWLFKRETNMFKLLQCVLLVGIFGNALGVSLVNADDNYEPNNTLDAAYDLSNSEQTWLDTIDGPGIQADDDWYKIEVKPGFERVLIDLRFVHLEDRKNKRTK